MVNIYYYHTAGFVSLYLKQGKLVAAQTRSIDNPAKPNPIMFSQAA
jgi:hypothetical protein